MAVDPRVVSYVILRMALEPDRLIIMDKELAEAVDRRLKAIDDLIAKKAREKLCHASNTSLTASEGTRSN